MTYDTLIVQTTSDLEYRLRFDSQDWDDRVEMLTTAWAEIEKGGVFMTFDGAMVRFNPTNVNAVLVSA